MSDGQEVLIQGFGHGLLAPGLMKFCSFGEDDTGRLHPVVQVAGDAVWLGRLLLWQLGTVGALGCLLLLKKTISRKWNPPNPESRVGAPGYYLGYYIRVPCFRKPPIRFRKTPAVLGLSE